MNNCINCLCNPICKEKENWARYCEEHIKLREKSILFDKDPVCPYLIHKDKYKKVSDEYFKNPFENIPKATYGDLDCKNEACPSKEEDRVYCYTNLDDFMSGKSKRVLRAKVGTNPPPKSKKPSFYDDSFF